MHHQMPQPAYAIGECRPLVMFNLARYAAQDLQGHGLLLQKATSSTKPDPALADWAKEYASAKNLDCQKLHLAMTVAQQESLVVLPRMFGWMNQQTFFGSAVLLLLTSVILVSGLARVGTIRPVTRLQHLIEIFLTFIRDQVVRPNIKHGDAWVPYFTALFLTILSFNMIGMFPFTATPTANILVNCGLAFTTMALMFICGFRAQGFAPFFRSLIPVHWSWKPMDMAIFVLLSVIEGLGLLIKPATLAVRLFANMFGGHTMMLTCLSLFYILFHAGAHWSFAMGMGIFGFATAFALSFLELLVVFIQAFVFVLLSAVFIGLSIHPEH